MTNHNNAAQAANENPLSDEYVNAIIQRHGYDSPESVIAQLHQWIGLHGGEDTVTLLMYEAHKVLSQLPAPVADEPPSGTRWPVLRAMARNYTAGKHTWDALDAEACEQAAEEIRHLRAALASAPVAVPVTPDLQAQIVALRRPNWPSTGDRSSFHEGYETARVDILRLLRRSAPVAESTDRAMLQSVLQDLEKSESVCPRCGHSDSCADMDVAYMIRDHLKGDASAPVDGEAQPTWDDLKSLAVKHSVWVPGYGPFAAELLATYGLAPAEQPHWLAAWLNAMNHAAPQASADAFDFVAHLARQAEFSARTFGPGARVAGVCDHIRKELIEVETSGGDLKEWVDVIILGLDGAWRSGATPQEIIAAIVAKQAKNEARTWPDWRTVDPTKAIEHDRGGQP